MKSKKFHKKLGLNKTTVANLNRNRMSVIYGGETEATCPYGTCTNCVSLCPHKCPPPDPTGGTNEGVTCVSYCQSNCLCTDETQCTC